MPISPDAALGVTVPTVLMLGGGIWKLATMLAEIRAQVRHGDGSMKDYVRDTRDDAKAARVAAEYANERAAKTEGLVARLDQRVEADQARQAEFVAAVNRRLEDLDFTARGTRTVLDLHVETAARSEIAWRAYEVAKGSTPPPPSLSPRKAHPDLKRTA